MENNMENNFEKNDDVMRKIYDKGFQKFVDSVETISDCFNLEKNKFKEFKKCICCMDERTPFGIHAAGSGILLSETDFDLFMKKNDPDCISSHDGCGAGKIFCKKNNLPLEDSDKYAREWAAKTAEKYGKKHTHISYEEMVGSKEYHHARVCYFDGTGHFNYSDPLPAGFVVNVVNRMSMPVLSSALDEVEAAIDFIFKHGLNIINEDNPFLLVAIGNREEELIILKQELASLNINEKLIKIDGFLAR